MFRKIKQQQVALVFALVFGALLCSATPANAACVNPAGEAGDQIYNTTHNVMQYCDSSNWVAMGVSSLGTWQLNGSNVYYSGGNVGLGTDNPSHMLHVMGDIRAGGAFVLANEAAVITCGGSETGYVRYNTSSGDIEVCNGTAWKGATGTLNALDDAKVFADSLYIGTNAGLNDTSGADGNTAVGIDALRSNVDNSSEENTAIGYQALYSATDTFQSTAVGNRALRAVTEGSNNTAIGYAAGDNITTGNNNIIIGDNVDAPSATGDSQLVIGPHIRGDLTGAGNALDLGTATGSLRLPQGTTAERPATACSDASMSGATRFNTDTNTMEICDGTSWVAVGTGSGGGGGSGGSVDYLQATTSGFTNGVVADTKLPMVTQVAAAGAAATLSGGSIVLKANNTYRLDGTFKLNITSTSGSWALAQFYDVTAGAYIGHGAQMLAHDITGSHSDRPVAVAYIKPTVDTTVDFRIANAAAATVDIEVALVSVQTLGGDGVDNNLGSMAPQWPDAIKCNVTTPAWGTRVFWLNAAPSDGGMYTYKMADDAAQAINFNANGTFNGYVTVSVTDCNKSINELYASSQAFDLVGSPPASPSSDSMVDGWPDVIKCSVTNPAWNGEYIFWAKDAPHGSLHTYMYQEVNYTINFNTADGTFNSTGAGLTTTDCDNKSITELYTDGQAFNIITNTANMSASTTQGWPDVIKCNVTSPAWGSETLFHLAHGPYGDSLYYYRYIASDANYNIKFNSDGSFSGYDSLTTTDCNKSITELYAEEQAFDLVGGAGASGVVSSAVSASKSVLPGWPDVIKCDVTNPNYGPGYFFPVHMPWTDNTYIYRSHYDWGPVYNADGSFNSYQGLTATDCDNLSISELYAAEMAFDLVGGVSNKSRSMTAKWPDAIKCNVTSPNYGVRVLWLSVAPNTDNKYYYREHANGGNTGALFNADGTWDSHETVTTSDCSGLSIEDLYNADMAFDLVGGGAGNIVPDFPDVIKCNVTSPNNGMMIFWLTYGPNAGGNYFYIAPDAGTVMQHIFDGAGAYVGVSGLTTTDCQNLSIEELYNAGRAFDIAGGGGGSGFGGGGEGGLVSGSMNDEGGTYSVSSGTWTNFGISIDLPAAGTYLVSASGLGYTATGSRGDGGHYRLRATGTGDVSTTHATAGASYNSGQTAGSAFVQGVFTVTGADTVHVQGQHAYGGTVYFYNPTMNYIKLDVAGSAGSNLSRSMVAQWPDVIYCTVSGAWTGPTTFWLQYGPYSDGHYWYRSIQSGSTYSVKFNSDGTFDSHDGGGLSTDCNVSITELYDTNRAFDLVGGGVDGPSSDSMEVGWPDVIKCNITNPASWGEVPFWLTHSPDGSSGLYVYRFIEAGTNSQLNFNADGSFNAYAGDVSASDCNKTMTELYADGQAFNLVTKTQNVSASMVTGWPDVLKCNVTSPSQGTVMFWLTYGPDNPGTTFYYLAHSGDFNYQLRYNTDGSYQGVDNLTTTDCNKSITQLYADGQAFDLVGGSDGATGGGSVNNASKSAIPGWPDAIKCLMNDGSTWIMSFHAEGGGGQGYYIHESYDNNRRLNFDSSQTMTSATTDGTTYSNCSASQTIADLYASGQAVDYVGGVSNKSKSIAPSFPDSIMCRSDAGASEILNLASAPGADGRYYYRRVDGSTYMEVIFSASGNWSAETGITTEAGGGLIDCSDGIAELYENDQAFDLVGGGKGNLVTNWPDVLKCNNGSATALYWLTYAPGGSGNYTYRLSNTSVYDIDFNADGTFNASVNFASPDCDNKSIDELYNAGLAFDIVGAGGTGGAVASNVPNSSKSMIPGYPDAIRCYVPSSTSDFIYNLAIVSATRVYYRVGRSPGDIYEVSFDLDGAWQNDYQATTGAGGGLISCHDGITALYEAGQAYDFVGGVPNKSKSLYSGWPDVITCNVTNPAWGQTPLYLAHSNIAPGRYYYRPMASPAGGDNFIIFNANGTHNQTGGAFVATDCDGMSIEDLYENNQAYDMVGSGNGNLVKDFPDVIKCDVTTPNMGIRVFWLNAAPGDGGEYTYKMSDDGYLINFAADGSFSAYSGLTTTDCNKTIENLYADGQAFDLSGGGLGNSKAKNENDSMTQGWPDAIRCSTIVSPVHGAVGTKVLYMDGSPSVASTYSYASPMSEDSDGNRQYNVTFNADGTYNGKSAGITSADCLSKTIRELYNEGNAYDFIGGVDNKSASAVPGWPDMIKCNVTNPAWNLDATFFLTGVGASVATYRHIAVGTDYTIQFNLDGTFNGYNNLTTTNCNTSINALYNNEQAFDLVGASSGAGTYLHVINNVTQAGVSDNDRLEFDTVLDSRGSDIINNGDDTFTLSAGRTYKLMAQARVANTAASAAWMDYRFYNITDAELIGSGGANPSADYSERWAPRPLAVAYITPDVDTDIELRVTGTNLSGSLPVAGASIAIEAVSAGGGGGGGGADVSGLTSGSVPFVNGASLGEDATNLTWDNVNDMLTVGKKVAFTGEAGDPPIGATSAALNSISDVTITTPADGQVLTYDSGSWVNQAASSSWAPSGGNISFGTGNVGINNSTPSARFVVNQSVNDNGEANTSIYGRNDTFNGHGVRGFNYASGGSAVSGQNNYNSATASGVYGIATGGQGAGVRGLGNHANAIGGLFTNEQGGVALQTDQGNVLLAQTNGNVGIGVVPTTDKLEVAGRIKDSTGYVAPVGTVSMFAGSSAPDGWLLCNGAEVSQATYADLFAVVSTTYNTGGEGGGNFRLPDFRGIFPRGAGTNHTLTDANSGAFSATLGTYQNDQMQGHRHTYTSPQAYDDVIGGAGTSARISGTSTTNDPVTDTSNGTPRTGVETRPANLGINFIIKY